MRDVHRCVARAFEPITSIGALRERSGLGAVDDSRFDAAVVVNFEDIFGSFQATMVGLNRVISFTVDVLVIDVDTHGGRVKMERGVAILILDNARRVSAVILQ